MSQIEKNDQIQKTKPVILSEAKDLFLDPSAFGLRMTDIKYWLLKFVWLLVLGYWLFPCPAFADITTCEKFFLEGRYDKSAAEARQLIDQRARQRDEIYYLKGLSELKLNRFDDARQSFQAIISKYPNSRRLFDANVGVGDSYFLAGNTEAAAKVYDEIKVRFPSDKNIALVDSRLNDCHGRMDSRLRGNDKSGGNDKEEIASSDTVRQLLPRNDDGEGAISVQAGCFKSRRNAENLSRKLSAKGYENYIEPPEAKDKLYRVKVGRIRSKSEAESVAAKLNKDGYRTKICV